MIDIVKGARLSKFNTLGVESTATEMVIVRSANELYAATETPRKLYLLGQGSNVVLRKFLNGRVIVVAIRGIEIESLAKREYRVRVGSGENWNELVRATVGSGIGGLENLSLIPGSVGAAPFQNISAYGRALSEVLESVEVFDLNQRMFRVLQNNECNFRYRDSIFKSDCRDRFIITQITLRIGRQTLDTSYKDVSQFFVQWPSHTKSARTIADSVARIRRLKLPDIRSHGNVGSFFKNPTLTRRAFDQLRSKLNIVGYSHEELVRVPAARLIDECGWKGRDVAGVYVWHKQPLVLVNAGTSKGRSFLELAERITTDVFNRFSIELELEPMVLGDDEAVL